MTYCGFSFCLSHDTHDAKSYCHQTSPTRAQETFSSSREAVIQLWFTTQTVVSQLRWNLVHWPVTTWSFLESISNFVCLWCQHSEMKKGVWWWYSNLGLMESAASLIQWPISRSSLFKCKLKQTAGTANSWKLFIKQMSLFFVFLKWQILWMNTSSMKLRSSWSPWPCWSPKVERPSIRSRAEQRAFIAHRHNQVSRQQLSMNAATNWLRYDGTHFILNAMVCVRPCCRDYSQLRTPR